MRNRLLFFLAVMLLPLVATAQNWNYNVKLDDGRSVALSEATISPSKPTSPVLQRKLTWSFDQRVKKNAAVKYCETMRSLERSNRGDAFDRMRKLEADFKKLLTDEKFFAEQKTELDAFEKELAVMPEDVVPTREQREMERRRTYLVYEYSRYCGWPRERFPMDKAKEFVARNAETFRLFEEASRCDDCDWEQNIRGNRNPIALRMEEIQDCRDLYRALAVKTKLEIYEGRYDDAVKSLRMGYRLAEHVTASPFIVSQLVANSIAGQLNGLVLELIQQPDAPNLYWPLTNLPRRLFDYRGSLDCELDFLPMMIPELAKALNDPESLSDDEWKSMQRTALLIYCEYGDLSSEGTLPMLKTDGRPDAKRIDLAVAAVNTLVYPKAKARLVEQGKTPEEIDRMAVAKIVGLYDTERFSFIRDEYFKEVELPRWETQTLNVNYFEPTGWNEGPVRKLWDLLSPAVGAYSGAITRTEREILLLRLVEAIRCHAADNGGKLPQSLDEIKELPIPSIDPYTGKPFSYKVENGTAVIEAKDRRQIFRNVIRVM